MTRTRGSSSRSAIQATSTIGSLLPVTGGSVRDGRGGELRNERVGVEPLQGERCDHVGGLPGGDQLGEGGADDRGGFEAVGAPAGRDVEVLELGLAEDRTVVGGEIAETGPSAE